MLSICAYRLTDAILALFSSDLFKPPHAACSPVRPFASSCTTDSEHSQELAIQQKAQHQPKPTELYNPSSEIAPTYQCLQSVIVDSLHRQVVS